MKVCIRDHSHLWGGLMQKGGIKLWRSEKGPEKYANYTPENWAYMIFYGVETYFPWGEKGGVLKNFAVQKEGGTWKFCSPKGGGEHLKMFCTEIFSSAQPPPPPSVLWMVPYYISWKLCTAKLLFHQSLCCTLITWWLESDGVDTVVNCR